MKLTGHLAPFSTSRTDSTSSCISMAASSCCSSPMFATVTQPLFTAAHTSSFQWAGQLPRALQHLQLLHLHSYVCPFLETYSIERLSAAYLCILAMALNC